MDERLARLEQNFDKLQQNFDKLVKSMNNNFKAFFRRINVSDDNSIARTANSLLLLPTDWLVPLLDVRNGNRIATFPKTSLDIERLNDNQVSELLRALGEIQSGTAEDRVGELRRKIGLRTHRVAGYA